MKLSKIEKKAFEKINLELNNIVNDSNLEKYDEFFEEDCEFRLEIIKKMINILLKEKELIKDLLIEEAAN
jgi:hypothetical protein